jgi:hypothetical protein
VARSENVGLFENQILDDPKPGENHDVHLREHENYRELQRLANPDNEEGFRLLDAHITMTRQLMAQEGAAGAGQPQTGPQAPEAAVGLNQGESPAVSPGEVAQDLLGAEGGATSL